MGQSGAWRSRAGHGGAERTRRRSGADLFPADPLTHSPWRSLPARRQCTLPSNHKWRSGGKSVLRDVVEWLRSLRYTCWLMSPAHLIPLGGRWWAEEYEFFSWSNVVCSRTGESDGALLLGWWNERVLFPFDCEGP